MSVDLDGKRGPTTFKAQQLVFLLKTMFPDCIIGVEKSRHGLHVKVVGKRISKIPLKERIHIREILGDDPYRIDHDKFKLKNNLPTLVDVLFSSKRDYDGKITYCEPIDLTMLPWSSKIPAKKLPEDPL